MTKSNEIRKARQRVAKQWLSTECIKSSAYVDLLTTLCREVNSPFSLAIYIAIRAGDWLNVLLLCKSLTPHNYSCHRIFSCDYQVVALIKKYSALPIYVDTERACAEKFIAAEKQCELTNAYLLSGEFYRNPVHNDIMHRAKRIIAGILPSVADIDYTTVNFSSGRTYGVKRNVSAYYKLNGPLEVTSKCHHLALEVLKANPGWVQALQLDPHKCNEIVTRRGDIYSSVPKDATTDRPLGIPPLFNAIIAGNVGVALRKAYKEATGIDIQTAQYTHKRVVQQASITGDIATIDLSSASDTISYAVIMELLPFDWFSFLDSIRSEGFMVKTKRPDGTDCEKWFKYHKFTAMGCGFTFELESIIFYAIVKACMDYDDVQGFLSVYGDDILLPRDSFDRVTSVLPAFGFAVNVDKSFGTGHFRESCGSDFFSGIDVRPFFLKDELTPRVLCLWHNTWIRKGYRYLFPRTFALLRKYIPKDIFLTLRAPLRAEGDTFLIDETLPKNTEYYQIVTVQRTAPISSYDVGLLPLILYRIERCSHDYLLGSRDRPWIFGVLDSTTPLRHECVTGNPRFTEGTWLTFIPTSDEIENTLMQAFRGNKPQPMHERIRIQRTI